MMGAPLMMLILCCVLYCKCRRVRKVIVTPIKPACYEIAYSNGALFLREAGSDDSLRNDGCVQQS